MLQSNRYGTNDDSETDPEGVEMRKETSSNDVANQKYYRDINLNESKFRIYSAVLYAHRCFVNLCCTSINSSSIVVLYSLQLIFFKYTINCPNPKWRTMNIDIAIIYLHYCACLWTYMIYFFIHFMKNTYVCALYFM